MAPFTLSTGTDSLDNLPPKPMMDIHIFDSSGTIRYPEEASDLESKDRENIRDLFFNSVYVMAEPEGINIYFKASTGTPEQFIGRVPRSDGEDPVRTACDQLTNLVERDLGWSIADPQSSEGQRVFSQLTTTTPTAIDRYDFEMLAATTETTPIDLGTPDLETAIETFKWVVRESPADLTVAIAGDGRTQFIADVDIVIVPGRSEGGVIGINGSDEDIQNTFIESKAAEATTQLANSMTMPTEASPNERQQQVFSKLNWWLSTLGVTDYIVATPAELAAKTNRQRTAVGSVTVLIGLVIGFVVGGGISHIGTWWNETIIGGSGVQFSLVRFVSSLLSISVPSLPETLVVGIGLLAGILWLAGGGAFIASVVKEWSKSASMLVQESEPHPPQLTQLQSINEAFTARTWASRTELIEAMRNHTTDYPAEVLLLTETNEQRRRLLQVGLVGLGTAVIGLGVGWVIGTVFDIILDYWLWIVEFVLLCTVVGALAGGVYIIWQQIFN